MRRSALALLLALAAIAFADPVTITVVDADTREPVAKFEYFVLVETADGSTTGQWRDWVAFDQADGTFTLDLPKACKLRLGVRAREYVYDYPGAAEYVITADPASRTREHKLHRGITVTGRVVENDTGLPIAGAQVSPEIFTPPGSGADRERSVFSDAKGQFVLPGVHRHGFVVEHAEYQQYNYATWDNQPGETIEQEVRLKPRQLFSAVVRDENGDPVRGAIVKDGSGTEAMTNADGRVERLSASYWGGRGPSFSVEVEARGFVEYRKGFLQIPEGGLEITLQRQFVIRGLVVGPDGAPIPSFAVWAGPGKAPSTWHCEATAVHDSTDGAFSIGINFEPLHNWVAIYAEGFAPFETWLPLVRDAEPIRIQLELGATITGAVRLDGAAIADGVAHLVFGRSESATFYSNESAAARFFSSTAPINPDGSFEFRHIRPGQYVLHVGGSNFTGRWMLASVRESGLTVAAIPVEGVGTVTGTVLGFDGTPWAFKDAELHHPAIWPGDDAEQQLFGGTIPFRTDENGNFRIEGVPVGESRVEVPFNVSADMMSSSGTTAVVEAGKSTEVAVSLKRAKPQAAAKVDSVVAVRIQIGDGSDDHWRNGTAQAATRKLGSMGDHGRPRDPNRTITSGPVEFSVYLDPIEPGPRFGDRVELTTNGFMSIEGVPPGRYLLKVRDIITPGRFSVYEPIVEKEIEVAGKQTAVEVTLGAGAITGRAVLPDLKPLDPGWAIAHAHLIGPDGKTHTAVADEAGAFFFRYLPPAQYQCFVRHENLGWCRFAPTDPNNTVADLGEIDLKPGATVAGVLRFDSICPMPTSIRAVSPEGVELLAVSYDRDRSMYIPEEFTIQGLWPGQWELNLMQGDSVLATAVATIPEAGPVTVELRVP